MARLKIEVVGMKDALRHISAQLDELIKLTREHTAAVTKSTEEIMADLSTLQAEVNENSDVVQSAVTLIGGLAQQLRDAIAANDPAAIQALADQLDAQTNSLAEAVANVPHVEHHEGT